MSQVFEDQTEDTFSLERFTDNCLPQKEKKVYQEVMVMLYTIEKFPQDFFSLKKESSRHKHNNHMYICIEFLSFFEKGR